MSITSADRARPDGTLGIRVSPWQPASPCIRQGDPDALSGVHSPVLRVITGSGDKAACQDTRPGPSAGQRNRLVEAGPPDTAQDGPRPARAGVAAATSRGMSL
jgi:hypothetical protein